MYPTYCFLCAFCGVAVVYSRPVVVLLMIYSVCKLFAGTDGGRALGDARRCSSSSVLS